MSIAVLTPTRERPDQLRALADAIEMTAEHPDSVVMYVATDDDDTSYDDLFLDVPMTWIIGARKQLAPWTNELLVLALEDEHEIVASFGDDHRPRTWGWDTAVREAMADLGSGLVYTRDGLQDERLPTAPFWSANILRELGWFFPPNQKHLYCDDFWLKFAQDIGRCAYLPDVLIEHMHPSATGETPDHINLENDSHHDADRAAFEAFIVSDEYRDCVARVKAIL